MTRKTRGQPADRDVTTSSPSPSQIKDTGRSGHPARLTRAAHQAVQALLGDLALRHLLLTRRPGHPPTGPSMTAGPGAASAR